MLNRRFLRIKVMQALYAFFQSDNQDIQNAEKDLIASFNNISVLYLWLLSLLTSIRHHAENVIEDARNKKLPTQQDLNPNTKFIENDFLKSLDNNKTIQQLLGKKKINWNNDDNLVRKIYADIKKSELYSQYMNQTSKDTSGDKQFILMVIDELLSEHELITHYFEEKNVHWADDLFVAFIGLKKTVETFDGSEIKLQPLYKNEAEDVEFCKKLFSYCIQHNTSLQEMISEKTVNWEVERIAQMDVLLMKMALSEILFFENVPVKVSLNEYIEISKEYSTPKSKIFINGILDKIVLELKGNNKIIKTGRGLQDK